MFRNIALLCIAVVLTSCKVGPNYHRPDVPAPPQFRDGEPKPTRASLGDVSWFDLFQDDVLRRLIHDALESNYDIRIAAQRILAAQGQVTVVRSTQFPRVDGQANAYRIGIN